MRLFKDFENYFGTVDCFGTVAISRRVVDNVTLAALELLLLACDYLLCESMDDFQQTGLIFPVFCEVEQPVRSEPDFGVTQMKNVAHPRR